MATRAGDAIGQSLDIIIPERLRARHWLGYRQVKATGESRYGHGDVLAVPGVRNDGERISLEFTIVPIRDGTGQMIGMAAIMRDVTTRFEEMRALRRKVTEAAKSARLKDRANVRCTRYVQSIQGTGRTDREELFTSARNEYGFLANVSDEHSPIEKVID